MKEIFFFPEGVDLPSFFSGNRIQEWLETMGRHYSVRIGTLSFIFCTDEYILDINRRYLSHDYYTDVITFDYSEGALLSGDIFISLDTVRSNADLYNSGFENEFYRVICHAVLHLIGFKDKTEPESIEMRTQENVCLELLKTL